MCLILSSAIGILTKYGKYIGFGIVGLLICIIAYLIYDYGQVKNNVDELKADKMELISNNVEIQKRIQNQKTQLTDLRERNDEINSDYNRAIEQISRLQSMTSEDVNSNREDIEKQVNQQIDDLTNRFQCQTGDLNSCREDNNNDNS